MRLPIHHTTIFLDFTLSPDHHLKSLLLVFATVVPHAFLKVALEPGSDLQLVPSKRLGVFS